MEPASNDQYIATSLIPEGMRKENSRRLGWVQKTISGDQSFLFETSFVDASTENLKLHL